MSEPARGFIPAARAVLAVVGCCVLMACGDNEAFRGEGVVQMGMLEVTPPLRAEAAGPAGAALTPSAPTPALVDPAKPLPYARPDLSPDPQERRLAEQMQREFDAGNLARAASLAVTVALSQMYTEGHRAYAEARITENQTAAADTEVAGSRREP